MGCAASSRIQPHPAEIAKDRKATAESERQLAKARAAQAANTNAALRFGQLFELTTPMLVMPFGVFKAQGRIMKSTKAWRDEALADGSLVMHEEGSSQTVIFISHTWWDKAAGGKRVDLGNKMLRPQHVGALFAAVERYQVAKLNLSWNQLGAEGGALVAAALKTNTTLTELW